MSALRTRWSAYVDQHHRYPTGPFGWLVGERMRRQHAPETEWSVGLLQLRPTDRVLELGFGVGRGLALALRQTMRGSVTGMDLSATMIRAAGRRNRAALARGQLALLRGDVAQLPFRQQQFDRILSIHTFYFWPDARALCQQLIALLAPGGRLVSTFATARSLRNGERVYWPLHEQAETLVEGVNRQPGVSAHLAGGPDSRQFNNVALVIDRR